MNLANVWAGQDTVLQNSSVPIFAFLAVVVTIMLVAAVASLARGGGRGAVDKED